MINVLLLQPTSSIDIVIEIKIPHQRQGLGQSYGSWRIMLKMTNFPGLKLLGSSALQEGSDALVTSVD